MPSKFKRPDAVEAGFSYFSHGLLTIWVCLKIRGTPSSHFPHKTSQKGGSPKKRQTQILFSQPRWPFSGLPRAFAELVLLNSAER